MIAKIAVVGESCRDEYVYGICDRVCPEAAALCFKNSGTKKHNIGMAGNTYGNLLAIDPNLDIDLITNQSTITKRRYIDTRYNSIIFREDINDECSPINLKQYDFSIYDYIIFSDYCKGFLSEESIVNICKSKKKQCITFIDTKKRLINISPFIDFIKVNSKEFEPNTNDLSLINKMCSLIITDGEHGAILYEKNNLLPRHYPTKKVILRDVCGAGDTFFAAFIYTMINTNNIGDSIEYANSCASKVVSKFGVSTI